MPDFVWNSSTAGPCRMYTQHTLAVRVRQYYIPNQKVAETILLVKLYNDIHVHQIIISVILILNVLNRALNFQGVSSKSPSKMWCQQWHESITANSPTVKSLLPQFLALCFVFF